MSCAINKLNLACSSHIKILRFPIFLEKKIFATGNGGGGWGGGGGAYKRNIFKM